MPQTRSSRAQPNRAVCGMEGLATPCALLMGRRTFSCDRERPVPPEAEGGKGLEGGADELLIAKATRCGRQRASSPVAFLSGLAGSRPRGSPEPRREAPSEPAPSFPGGRGDPAPPRPATGAQFQRGSRALSAFPAFPCRTTSPPDPASPQPPIRSARAAEAVGRFPHGGGALRTGRRRGGADHRPARAPQRRRRGDRRSPCARASRASRPTTAPAPWSSPGPGERPSARAPT